jgi:hypothetical protein
LQKNKHREVGHIMRLMIGSVSTVRLLAVLAMCAPSLLWWSVAKADALMVTKAMTASTIAEIFIENDHVRVELEIGLVDLEAFRNLLPDELARKIDTNAPALAQRLPRFFFEDMTVRPDDGPPLAGLVQAMEWRKRVKRDQITGEPLPPAKGEGEMALIATLYYPFKGHPKTLAFKSPFDKTGGVAASVGFVVYHRGLPVNDFRYLSGEPTIDLDWEDPWYSKFRHRNLWRKYNAPINVFLYVEPYEVRVEVIARPMDLQQWVDLGLEGHQRLPVEMQPELKERVGAFLAEHMDLTVDGQDVSPTLDRKNFLRRTLRTSAVVEPDEELDLISATLGMIYVHPTSGLPKQATLTWDLFSSKLPVVRAAATDEAGPMPAFLRPDDNVLMWKNFLKNPTMPKLTDIEPPAALAPLSVPIASAVCLILLIGMGVRGIRTRRPAVLVSALVLLIAAVVAWPYGRVSVANPLAKLTPVSDEDANEVLGALLKNIYAAFDFRDESTIYDALARSATGDLLTQIYLETQKSLELRSQGGARVKVKEVNLINVDQKNLQGELGFVATCTWNVRGSVGHWGHIHQRVNQYQARISVKPVNGKWKIFDLELLDEKRISTLPQARSSDPLATLTVRNATPANINRVGTSDLR